jgi:predicted DNA-binding transcriptional regulator AlpA
MKQHDAISQPLYLQTPAAAARLGLSPSTLEKMRGRGDGPKFIRLTPKRVAYSVAALEEWVRAREYRSVKEYSAAAA